MSSDKLSWISQVMRRRRALRQNTFKVLLSLLARSNTVLFDPVKVDEQGDKRKFMKKKADSS